MRTDFSTTVAERAGVAVHYIARRLKARGRVRWTLRSVVSAIALVATIAGCGAPVQRPLRPLALDAAVLSGGERIYVGRVFPLTTGSDAAVVPLFTYERRVSAAPSVDGGVPVSPMRSTHITRDAKGAVVVAESALHSIGYDLLDYELYGDQLQRSGSVQVRGQRVSFLLRAAGKGSAGEQQQVAEEQQSAPVVVGPTLVGFIARQRASLAAGQVIAIRLAVLERLETLGFELRSVPAASGQTRVEMAASSLLIGLVVKPLYFTFDAASGNLLRMEGRVPPKAIVGEHWQDLDARVEYAYAVAAYR